MASAKGCNDARMNAIRTRQRVLRVLIETRGYAPLARAVGTSPGYLHDIAHGRRGGSRDTLSRLARELGVHLSDLIEDDLDSDHRKA